MVHDFKAHVLSYLEYRTPGIYHAATTVITSLDRILERFLRDINMTSEEALMNCNLAPLATRRDIAMLGLIHRTVLGLGPRQFQKWFQLDPIPPRFSRRLGRNYSKRLVERSDLVRLDIGCRSIFGLIRIYNLLPDFVVHMNSVHDFQSALTGLLKEYVGLNFRDWALLYSPRLPIVGHPLSRI